MDDTTRISRKVGLFVVIALAIIGGLILNFSKGASVFRPSYTITVQAENVGGLVSGAGVMMAGVPIGSVRSMDLSPDGKEIWAGLNAEGAIDIVDTATNKFKEKVAIGGRPYRVRFTPDGSLVVNTMVATKEILIVDAATRKEVRRIKLESVPLGIAFSTDGKTAFVSVVEPDAVLKINLDTGAILGRVDTGKGPDGIAVAGM